METGGIEVGCLCESILNLIFDRNFSEFLFLRQTMTSQNPKVNSDYLNAYLDEFSKYLGKGKILFVLDGAAWHKAGKLKKKQNIEFVYLPPYSPELNPVERFWEHLKGNTIKNKIFDTLACLEEEISSFIRGIATDVVSSVCHVSYL